MSIITVREQYEAFPYPTVSLFSRLNREQLWQIHVPWILRRCGLPVVPKPSIWIAGCGTYQPYVFALANPDSPILATDLSHASLRLAQKRTRGQTKIRFQALDLNDPVTLPDETFDYIECYGVLMSLAEPAKTLQWLASRLKPNGVLRVMVYPHYGRQRIFQIQRLAKLFDLNLRNPQAPQKLRELLMQLPKGHPLRRAFFSYYDSKTQSGVIDGFFHAADRGFTGIEIAAMADQAGLDLGFCMHRPWGQPKEQAERLGLVAHDPALWLHYLDLWQELRTNYILCLVKRERDKSFSPSVFRHALFSTATPGLRHQARLWRMGVTGGRLQTRMGSEPLKLKGLDFRKLNRGERSIPEITLDDNPEPLGPFFMGTSQKIHPNDPFVFRIGERVWNPLYCYLMDAFCFSEQWKGSFAAPFPCLPDQLKRWKQNAHPLEDEMTPFGLTPYGTYESFASELGHGDEEFWECEKASFEEFSLPNENFRLNELHRRFASFLPKETPLSMQRQLWVLLCSNGLYL